MKIQNLSSKGPKGIYLAKYSVDFAYQDPGSGTFLTPGSGMGKKSGSGFEMNDPFYISESVETIFWVKILKFFDADSRSGMEKLIRDPGSRINIPDPQHWFFGSISEANAAAVLPMVN